MSSGPSHAPSSITIAEAPASRRHRPYIVLLGSPIGFPQIIAGLLLALFLGQCLWLAVHTPLRDMELAQIQWGQTLLHQQRFEQEASRSPIIPLLAAAPLIGSGIAFGDGSHDAVHSASPNDFFYPHPHSWRWRARLPFIAIGLLLGASLWYVARRLYGNSGAYIALALFAFSPPIITRAAAIHPAIVAGWGAFGMVFTAIAVAHTLYAPREVVLWNWKRMSLLGLAIALALGSHLALAATVLLAFAFMLYVAPERRAATLAIMMAACALAAVLLFAACAFQPQAVAAISRGLRSSDFAPQLLARKVTYTLLAIFFLRMPGVLLALAAALITYAAWKRPRYFGVSAPLIAFAAMIFLGITMPHLGGYDLFIASLPFAFVFIGGVFADLLETAYGGLVGGIVGGIILAQALYSLAGLIRIG